MSKSVFCTATVLQTETIVSNLKAAGFLMADKSGTRDFAIEHNTKAPEGAVAGYGTGVVLGGTLGWLAGIGSLAIPGLGPLVAAGPIMAALSGAAIGGAVGGVSGALIGMGMSEFEAKQYEGKVKTGSSLISVHSEDADETARAKEIFTRAGATDCSTACEEAVPSGSRA